MVASVPENMDCPCEVNIFLTRYLLIKEVDIPKWGVMYRGLVNHIVYFTFSTKCLKDNEGCIKCQRVVVCDGSVMFSALTPTQVQGRFRSMSGIFVTPWSRF